MEFFRPGLACDYFQPLCFSCSSKGQRLHRQSVCISAAFAFRYELQKKRVVPVFGLDPCGIFIGYGVWRVNQKIFDCHWVVPI